MKSKASMLPSVWEVPQVFRDRLGSKVGRQRVMFADGHLLLVLHAPPSPGEDTRTARFYWRQPDGVWQSSEGGQGVNALHRNLEEYAERVEHYDRMEESASSANDYFVVLEALGPLHRAALNTHKALQEARTLVPEDRDLIDVRDRAYEIVRQAELLGSHSKNSLDFEIARQGEKQAEASRQMAVSAHRLNVLVAFFFPIATLCAIFSTNMKSGVSSVPEPWGFVVVMAVGLLCGIILTRFITRPARGK